MWAKYSRSGGFMVCVVDDEMRRDLRKLESGCVVSSVVCVGAIVGGERCVVCR